MGAPRFNLVKMGDMSLEYIAAITDSLEFPSIDSPPIEGIPDGFSDFEFYDIIMEVEFFNEIGIPVGLDMELSGIIEGIIDTKKVIINTNRGKEIINVLFNYLSKYPKKYITRCCSRYLGDT